MIFTHQFFTMAKILMEVEASISPQYLKVFQTLEGNQVNFFDSVMLAMC